MYCNYTCTITYINLKTQCIIKYSECFAQIPNDEYGFILTSRAFQRLPDAYPQPGHLRRVHHADHPREHLPVGHPQRPPQAGHVAAQLTATLRTRLHLVHLRVRKVGASTQQQKKNLALTCKLPPLSSGLGCDMECFQNSHPST